MKNLERINKIADKITSNHIKTALMHYFRYTRQAIVATEVDFYSYGVCDVVADTGSCVYDVEVKISISDLKHDFEKYKHYLLEKSTNYDRTYRMPTYFYYCLPEYLIEKAKEILNQKGNKFGILSYNPYNSHFLTPEKYITVVQRGKKLHGNYGTHLRDKIIQRMASELCIIYKKKYGDPRCHQK